MFCGSHFDNGNVSQIMAVNILISYQKASLLKAIHFFLKEFIEKFIL